MSVRHAAELEQRCVQLKGQVRQAAGRRSFVECWHHIIPQLVSTTSHPTSGARAAPVASHSSRILINPGSTPPACSWSARSLRWVPPRSVPRQLRPRCTSRS